MLGVVRSSRVVSHDVVSRSLSSPLGLLGAKSLAALAPSASSSVATCRASFSSPSAGATEPLSHKVSLTPAASPPPSPSSRATIVKLLQNIESKKEVEQYLRYYAELEKPKFAVIKVGGGIIADELDILADSLAFLAEVGLLPVVIHGAGPQLNAELKKKNVVSDYIGGMRITTPDILLTAKKVFHEANLKLVTALEERGIKVRPIVSGVFEAEFLDQSRFQFVGKVTNVDPENVFKAIEHGSVPILTCMGESSTGQLLNINADVAAQELAKKMLPVKIVYLSQNGGIANEKGDIMSQIDLEKDFDRLMNEDWFKHGNRLKLKEIKTLLDDLPLSSSVSITSALNLPKELFTNKGAGTLVKRHEKILSFSSLQQVDKARLKELIESSFGAPLSADYFEQIAPKIHQILVNESYGGCAILTKEDGLSTPYLDKFAVAKSAQSEGTGAALWEAIKERKEAIPALFWRSRSSNPVNKWYFERAQGAAESPDGQWQIFWFGLQQDWQQIRSCYEKALSLASTIDRSRPLDIKELHTGPFSTVKPSVAGGFSRGFHTGRRGFSSSAFSSARSFVAGGKKGKVGIIGGRGHTGAELIRLLSRHSALDLALVSSRALKGQQVTSIVADLPSSLPWRALQIEDLSAEQLPSRALQIGLDAIVLALPNNLAAPYVAQLRAQGFAGKVVDLSADYRFWGAQKEEKGEHWTYGLVEKKGQRKLLSQASLISNPGCYATGSQLSLLPLASSGSLLTPSSFPSSFPSSSSSSASPLFFSSPSIFGVSGYSGAGTTPSRKNDLAVLKDNLIPYAQIGHIHEKEISFHLDYPVRFMPNVASFFRGIALSVDCFVDVSKLSKKEQIVDLFRSYYDGEPLVRVTEETPEVSAIAGKHHVEIGGFNFDPSTGRLVLNTTIDNLLKGAATQCLQNVNLSLGLRELDGILPENH